MSTVARPDLGKPIHPVRDADAARSRWVFQSRLILPPIDTDTVSISAEARREFIRYLSSPRR